MKKKHIIAIVVSSIVLLIILFSCVEIATDYYDVSTPEELQSVDTTNYTYVVINLTSDIDLSGYKWQPIGTYEHPFNGEFYGNGYTIKNLTIDTSRNAYINNNCVGLFGETNDSIITELKLEDISVNAPNYEYVGGIVGNAEHTTITKSYVTGNIIGQNNVGGIAGRTDSTVIKNSYSTTNIEGVKYTGGIIGQGSVELYNSYATGDITGSDYVGGLVGYLENVNSRELFPKDSLIKNAYYTGNITGVSNTGKIVGSRYSLGGTSIFYAYYFTEQTLTCDCDEYISGRQASFSDITEEWFTNTSNWYSSPKWSDTIWDFSDLSEYSPKLIIENSSNSGD